MTEAQMTECLAYAESLIETKLREARPRCGGDIYARTLGERSVYWLEEPIEPRQRRAITSTQIDFQGFFTKRTRGEISYGEVNDSWDETTQTPNIIQFSALVSNTSNVILIDNRFGDQATLYQDYTQEEPFPIAGYNKIDLQFTFGPVELSFPVRVVFEQSTTIDGNTEIDFVVASFNSASSQTLNFSLGTFGSRIIRLVRVEI